jgi:hypothetical protein
VSEPTPIPEAETLTIAWPAVAPLDIPLSASDVKDVWDTFIVKNRGPQSIEERSLMAILRAVYDGMYGIYDQETYDAFKEANA